MPTRLNSKPVRAAPKAKNNKNEFETGRGVALRLRGGGANPSIQRENAGRANQNSVALNTNFKATIRASEVKLATTERGAPALPR